MATIWKMGAIRKPRNMVYVKYSPSVSVWSRMWLAPTYMMMAPTMPMSNELESCMTLCAVSVASTLSSSRLTPSANTFCSRCSA